MHLKPIYGFCLRKIQRNTSSVHLCQEINAKVVFLSFYIKFSQLDTSHLSLIGSLPFQKPVETILVRSFSGGFTSTPQSSSGSNKKAFQSHFQVFCKTPYRNKCM